VKLNQIWEFLEEFGEK